MQLGFGSAEKEKKDWQNFSNLSMGCIRQSDCRKRYNQKPAMISAVRSGAVCLTAHVSFPVAYFQPYYED
jgi:hypothetical protein